MKTGIASAFRAGKRFSGSESGGLSSTAAVSAESADACLRAVRLLQHGEIVGLPTETVYGLAADALNPDAVAKIFEAKERPRFDPLIVHLPTCEALDAIAIIENPIARDLIEKFWPGPLTIVLRKRDVVPDIVTAGLETVAVRLSAHPVFREIISAFDGPLAAPSANRFGRISPTTTQHVLDELDGRIPLIVDAGATKYGIESTIVRIVDDVIEVLRRGPIPEEVLRRFGKVRERTSSAMITAPGQLATHYSPQTKLILVESLQNFSAPNQKRIGALFFRKVMGVDESGTGPPTVTTPHNFAAVRYLNDKTADLPKAAAKLFRMLRELDAENLDVIVAERVPGEGIGAAINDRLERASNRRTD